MIQKIIIVSLIGLLEKAVGIIVDEYGLMKPSVELFKSQAVFPLVTNRKQYHYSLYIDVQSQT